MKAVEARNSVFCFWFETANLNIFLFLFFSDSRVFFYSIACRLFVRRNAALRFVSALALALGFRLSHTTTLRI
jgi:hypothetical protein